MCQPASFAHPRLDEAALASLLTPSNFSTLFPCLRTLELLGHLGHSVNDKSADVHPVDRATPGVFGEPEHHMSKSFKGGGCLQPFSGHTDQSDATTVPQD